MIDILFFHFAYSLYRRMQVALLSGIQPPRFPDSASKFTLLVKKIALPDNENKNIKKLRTCHSGKILRSCP
ncbi:MAG: hypothetical protein A2268_11340 [Candidatus Raymondbacteria bacterium RifOxyA12_full_50_37]|uniref:Uncharacterized protein n=1 Tax=Candidatus Raymondbacteria bacterium RIFOXYD12_FULL_49_13 TaxID=1817890 RepID=A0A1F7FAW0_UNCRA|nr:MAG: hypothetical protein A2268_11340 [Candidatus Raymondbacteria bacterium RifOxyA12_full_50_37]OGJ91547.1 MAG: hypothetical protein A2350_08180 [Candidatus Raymondbacteria bacterium RifOxyB12_full_50_8]OGJ92367.1 MAG: hypothetical protein A2248_10465 [Candidatus Raymondbacteria bacterium RIFOXYA2_FULL_49_16]OGJ99348.1 MAG: hypothetical protein A2453_13525 [Candidatus Raymondbacteria bacterium RIFOXYC2_FULL_50_21]OGK03637.1 MAG: hypothetical protein A2519_02600 [Candidatus Raymondbacteria b